MKTMLKVTISLFFLLLTSVATFAQNGGEKWSYKAADAPYGYESGEITFSKKGEILYAQITINGHALDPVKVTQEKGKKEISLHVDGADVLVVWAPKTKSFATGKASFDGSEIAVELTKKATATCTPNSGEKWSYTAANAPYGYESGKIEFSKKGGALYATISFDGYALDPVKVTKKGQKSQFSIYVDGSDILVEWSPKTNNIATATASFDGSSIAVELNQI